MITISEYANHKVGVFGLGKAGEATVAALLAGGAQVYAWDDGYTSPSPLVGEGGVGGLSPRSNMLRHSPLPNPPPQGGRGLQYVPVAQWPWAEIKALVLSPGVPLTHPKPHDVVAMAQSHNCPIIGDIELLFRACSDATYVGITGTNGKSTTTTLIGHILQSAGLDVQVGGNLGTAALSLQPLGKGGIYVLELSSYQLDLVRTTRFNVATFLNVTPDHIDRHGDMEGYIAAKMHLFERQEASDTAVVAVDDEYTKRVAARVMTRSPAAFVSVSTQKLLPDAISVEKGVLHDGAQAYDLSSIATLTGRHNWQNAGVAYGVAKACGVAPDAIYEAMKTFAGLRHRLQLVATIRGVRFINDSKATNADSTSHALAPYDTIYWIAGGKAKAGGIEPLAPYFSKITHAFLIGAAEEEFAATLEGNAPYTRCGTLEVAVKKAAEMAFAEHKPGAVVLLSPACASFDQWKSFEQRGDAFCSMVEALDQDKRHAV